MSIRIREQFICCLFAVILFLSGMCVEIPMADTSFLYAKDSSGTEFASSVLCAGKSYTVLEQDCTLEMLRTNNATILSSNIKHNQVGRFVRMVVALLTVVILLCYAFCLNGAKDVVFAKTVNSHTTIVRYIQQTDGKKI